MGGELGPCPVCFSLADGGAEGDPCPKNWREGGEEFGGEGGAP